MILIDAVNLGLRAIGETKIPDGVDLNSLDNLHEANQIKDIITELNKEHQIDGWWFNKEDSWTFIPDSTTKRVSVPTNVLSIRGVSTNLSIIGGNLYDKDNQTLEFDEDVDCITIFERDFEDTPESFARWIAYKSAQEAQWLFKGDDFSDRKLERRVSEAFISLERESLRNKNINLITSGRLSDRSTNPTPTV